MLIYFLFLALLYMAFIKYRQSHPGNSGYKAFGLWVAKGGIDPTVGILTPSRPKKSVSEYFDKGYYTIFLLLRYHY